MAAQRVYAEHRRHSTARPKDIELVSGPFVSVFGIAVQDALLMVTYFQRLHFVEGLSVEAAAREASEKRFRPVLMTTLVATLGLLPAALSNGIGAQTQKPLAIVVIGGSLGAPIPTRVLQPAV